MGLSVTFCIFASSYKINIGSSNRDLLQYMLSDVYRGKLVLVNSAAL